MHALIESSMATSLLIVGTAAIAALTLSAIRLTIRARRNRMKKEQAARWMAGVVVKIP